jgi:nitroreductase
MTMPLAAVRAQLQWRYATKQFDPARTIPAETWQVLEDSLWLAPSSFGLQPWKFLVVDTPALRQELRKVSWNQAQITEASKLVVLAGRRSIDQGDIDRLIQRTAELRQQPLANLDGYRKMLSGFVQGGWVNKDLAAWNARQVYIALGQLLTTAAMLGIDACPMEGIDMAAYDRLLGLDGTPFTTLCSVPLGYRHASDKYATLPKVRMPREAAFESR